MKCFVQHGPYIAIDFETSASSGPCACAIGLARVENFEIKDTYYTLIRPPSSKINYTHIHGLNWAQLKNEKTFPELWPKLKDFFSDARFFIAHNAVFDRKILRACCEGYNLPFPKMPFLCTLLGSRRMLNIPSKSLSSVAAHFDIPLNHHHAGSDATACAQIHIRLRQMGLKDEQMKLGSSYRPPKPEISKKL